MNEQDIVERLRIRAEIRRQIPGRKSVQEGQPDRIADLLEEAAQEIDRLRAWRDSAFEVHPNLDLDVEHFDLAVKILNNSSN